MFKKIEKEKIQLTCPLCRKSINEVWACKIDSVIGIRYAYFCSDCQKMLSLSEKKEFHPELHNFKYDNNRKKILS